MTELVALKDGGGGGERNHQPTAQVTRSITYLFSIFWHNLLDLIRLKANNLAYGACSQSALQEQHTSHEDDLPRCCLLLLVLVWTSNSMQTIAGPLRDQWITQSSKPSRFACVTLHCCLRLKQSHPIPVNPNLAVTAFKPICSLYTHSAIDLV